MNAPGSLIAAALVKAQSAFGPALKTSTNPHFKSRYADLGACIEAVVEALNANGIALLQRTHPCESGVIVETVFLHASGESWSSGPLHVPSSKNDAQGYGSALTYARRYSLMAACGHAPEEDDGNAAAKKRPTPKAEGSPESSATISPTKIAYEKLSPDWKAYIDSLSVEVENTFTAAGPGAAQEIIDINTQRDDLGPDELAGLQYKLRSTTRSAIKAHTAAKAA